MALTDYGNGLSAADVAAVTGNNNGFGGWGGDASWWLIILFLFIFNGNWGNNGFGGGAGAYPYYGVGNEVQRGFDQSAIMSGLSGIQSSLTSGFVDTATTLCNGFAGVNGAISNGFAQAEIAANARQMADMNQNFALQSQFADCCCENRLASADLKYTIATENCADRTALNDGIRDILTNQNNGIQKILDTMCQDKIDAKNERIAQWLILPLHKAHRQLRFLRITKRRQTLLNSISHLFHVQLTSFKTLMDVTATLMDAETARLRFSRGGVVWQNI